MVRHNLSLSLHLLCHPQISTRHKFRLFHVLEAVIGAIDSLEETWEKTFIELALENMTKSTVGLPSPAHRPLPRGPSKAGGAQPCGGPSDFCPVSPHRLLRRDSLTPPFIVRKGSSASSLLISGHRAHKCKSRVSTVALSALSPEVPAQRWASQ